MFVTTVVYWIQCTGARKATLEFASEYLAKRTPPLVIYGTRSLPARRRFGPVDGPGFNDEAGGGWLSVGPRVGGRDLAVDN